MAWVPMSAASACRCGVPHEPRTAVRRARLMRKTKARGAAHCAGSAMKYGRSLAMLTRSLWRTTTGLRHGAQSERFHKTTDG